MKNYTLYLLLFTHCCLTHAKQQEVPICGKTPRPMRIEVRHIEPGGIGYNQGYTTLEGFFTPTTPYQGVWVPFLDLRGHVFNDGKLAANAGTGFRYIGSSRIWGMNGYYDYRNTHHQHYNQVSLGFESLGRLWDFRLNGYLPVGKKTSALYHPKFSHFSGNSVYISQKQEFAMKGANAEAGFHLDRIKNIPFYFAAGPYYLEGKGRVAWGGQLRAVMDLFDYVRVEGNVSYDNVFKWVGQGQLSLIIPFGKRRTIKSRKRLCPTALALGHRALQRVDRSEIIPVDTKRKESLAIDPATGLPWVFFFVNNTSHSAGTYESPFNSLLAAEAASSANQAIFVYPGDGTTNRMNQGIVLKNGQLFLGAGVANPLSTTAGTITLPAMAASAPNITNSAGSGNVVTLANNNRVAGFNITTAVNDSSGIYGTDSGSLVTYANTFSTLGGITTNGIYLLNPSDQVLVTSSIFNGFNDSDSTNNGNGIFIELDGASLNTLNVTNNTFINLSNPTLSNGGSAILVYTSSSGTIDTLNATNNTLNNFNSGSVITNFATISNVNFINNSCINFNNAGGVANYATIATLNFIGNECSEFVASDPIFNAPSGGPGTIGTINFNTNTFLNFDIFSYAVANFDAGIIGTINSSLNRFDGFTNASLAFINVYTDSTIQTLNSIGDVFVNFGTGSIAFSTYADTSITTLNITGDTFTHFTGSSIGIYNDNTSPISHLNVSKSSFSLDDSTGISYALGSTNATAQITNNTFSGTDNLTTGYGAAITVNGGALCLEFTDNKAASTSGAAPYALTQTGGVFNRTSGSDNSTNIGEIATSGTINTAGSCQAAQ